MIHAIEFQHDGHTYLFRFSIDKVDEVRLRLCLMAKNYQIPWLIAFDANRQLLALGKSTMNEIETIAEQLTRKGIFVQFARRPGDWLCTLTTSTQQAWRMPMGHGSTQMDALAAALDDLGAIRKQMKLPA